MCPVYRVFVLHSIKWPSSNRSTRGPLPWAHSRRAPPRGRAGAGCDTRPGMLNKAHLAHYLAPGRRVREPVRRGGRRRNCGRAEPEVADKAAQRAGPKLGAGRRAARPPAYRREYCGANCNLVAPGASHAWRPAPRRGQGRAPGRAAPALACWISFGRGPHASGAPARATFAR